MRFFISVTNSIIKRHTSNASVTAKMIKSNDGTSNHHSIGECPIILCINGTHMAHNNGRSQLNPIALFTPLLLVAKFANLIAAFCFDEWNFRCFCCLIVDEPELESSVEVPVVEDSDDGVVVAVVIVVVVLIDIFFIDDNALLWAAAAAAVTAAGVVDVCGCNCIDDVVVKSADVCISNSDWIINTMATSVDELNNKTAAKLLLNNPYHSCKGHKYIVQYFNNNKLYQKYKKKHKTKQITKRFKR